MTMSRESPDFDSIEETPEAVPPQEALASMKAQESEALGEAEHAINTEGNPEQKGKKMRRLAVYALTTLLAACSADDAFRRGTTAQEGPRLRPERMSVPPNRAEIEAQRRVEYQAFEAMTQERGTLTKIKFLRKHYGPVVDNFFYNHHIDLALELLDSVKTRLARNDSAVLAHPERPDVFATPASLLLQFVRERWTPLTREEKEEKNRGLVEIKGFELVPGMSNDAVDRSLHARYPRPWLHGSTKSITYVPQIKTKKEAEGYIIGGDTRPYGIAAMLEQDTRAPAYVYNVPEGRTFDSVSETLDHEIAHNNDWDNCRLLSNQERIDFFFEVTERFASDDRFMSLYVESLAFEDENIEKYIKAREYWATINEEYHGSRREAFRREHPKDAALVERWFSAINGVEAR